MAPPQSAWRRGIRIGSAKDGKLLFFIPDPDTRVAPETTDTLAAEEAAHEAAAGGPLARLRDAGDDDPRLLTLLRTTFELIDIEILPASQARLEQPVAQSLGIRPTRRCFRSSGAMR